MTNAFVHDDEDLMIGWLIGYQQELGLDPELSSRSTNFVASKASVDAK